jgi:2-polyprenyl-3-methyl-5-hydroxy-6-metoxy-1,4-benzoquinol methylase
MKQKKSQFTALAEYYDRLNGADYKEYANYIEKVFKKHGSGKENLILDLACGTGALTEALCQRGYDMIGADISDEMLSLALSSAFSKSLNILYLKQDMTAFELYGTVDAIICALDGISYLEKREDVLKCFKLIRNYLNPGALFLFDVNSAYRFKEIFAKQDFFVSDGGVYLGWKNNFSAKTGKCDFLLTLFVENKDGSYTKKEEIQTEKMWEMSELSEIISESGLELLTVYGGPDMKDVKDDSEKWYFVCRCPFEK